MAVRRLTAAQQLHLPLYGIQQGVIAVEQEALLGGNVQELLDNLQATIAG